MSEETTDAPNALCAFTVVVDGEGAARIFRLGVQDVRPVREPTVADLRRAVLELNSELQAGLVLDRVVAALSAQQEPSVGERVAAALERSGEPGDA